MLKTSSTLLLLLHLYLCFIVNQCLCQVIHYKFTIEPKAITSPLTLSTSSHNSNPISFLSDESKLSVSLEHILLIDVIIGTPPQKKRIKLGTHPLELWVLSDEYTNGYSSSQSTTSKSLDTCHSTQTNGGIKGEAMTDNVILFNHALPHFPFLNVIKGNVDQRQYEGGIGFGYKYEQINFSSPSLVHNDYSVLDTLKKANKIDKRILNVDFTTQTISLGSLEMTFIRKYYKTCNLVQMTYDNKPNPKWECIVDSAYFEGEGEGNGGNGGSNKGRMFYYKINKPVTFSLGSNVLLVSSDFFEYIIKHYLKAEYDSGLCMTSPFGKYYIIDCMKLVRKCNIPPITFVIGKWSIKIPFADLLLENKVMIAKSEKKRKWIFGYPFLKRYLNVFNKEDNTFGLYINSNSNNNKNYK